MAHTQYDNDTPLATELIREVKAQSKRWFVAFIIVLALWFGTIAGFMWYISLPTDTIDIENDSGNTNYIGNDLKGDLNNGQNNSN